MFPKSMLPWIQVAINFRKHQTEAHLNRVLAHGPSFWFGFGFGGGWLSDEEVNVVDQAKENESYVCWCLRLNETNTNKF